MIGRKSEERKMDERNMQSEISNLRSEISDRHSIRLSIFPLSIFLPSFFCQQLVSNDAFLTHPGLIRRLTHYVVNRELRFKADSPGCRLLVDQLMDFPLAGHDDGPDALETCLRLPVEVKRLR